MVIRVKKILSSYLKPNAEWSVFVVEILRSKSETIMSKREYVLMAFCLKNKARQVCHSSTEIHRKV